MLSFIKDPEKKAAIQMILKLEGTQGKTGFSRWFGDNPIDGAKYGKEENLPNHENFTFLNAD